MIYTFAFDWGETWTVTEDDFLWKVEYWCKVVARHIHLFRQKIAEVKPVDLITTVEISQGNDYFGMVSVSDDYVHVFLHVNNDYLFSEVCWRIEEL